MNLTWSQTSKAGFLASMPNIVYDAYYVTITRQTLKRCWFAVLLPTHQKQALPPKNYFLSENLFFVFLSSLNKVNK